LFRKTIMTRHSFPCAAVLASALLCAAGQAFARDTASAAQEEHTLREHPAVLVKRQGPVLDTNRFILAHPAQLAVIEAPTPTYAHPAVAVQRMARESAELERNMAQPPIASAWLRRSPLAASVETKASGS
jgi:hypothetical protein